MALIYTNENIEQQVVNALRALRRDVLTSLEAVNANRSMVDEDVLTIAARRTLESLFVVSISTTAVKRSEFMTFSSRALPMSLYG